MFCSNTYLHQRGIGQVLHLVPNSSRLLYYPGISCVRAWLQLHCIPKNQRQHLWGSSSTASSSPDIQCRSITLLRCHRCSTQLAVGAWHGSNPSSMLKGLWGQPP